MNMAENKESLKLKTKKSYEDNKSDIEIQTQAESICQCLLDHSIPPTADRIYLVNFTASKVFLIQVFNFLNAS